MGHYRDYISQESFMKKVNGRNVLSCHPADPRRQLESGSSGVKLATGCKVAGKQASCRNWATVCITDKSKNTKHQTLTIGTWNVRGLIKAGKLETVEKEMDRYKLDVLGLSETHLKENGHSKTGTGMTMITAGREDNSFSGVGILLSRRIANKIIGYDIISDTIILLKLGARPHPINLIQVYAPTSSSSEEDITEFYNKLGQVYQSLPSKEITVLLGDLNAKIGTTISDDHIRDIVGRFGLGDRNERGQRLLDFCAEHNLTIMNSWFKQHPRRLYTWTSPNGKYRNQIDFVMVGKRWRSSITYTKTRPGADCGSDHQLLAAAIKIRLKATKKKLDRKPIYLPIQAEKMFRQSAETRIRTIVMDPFESAQAQWETFKEVALRTADEMANKIKEPRPRSNWIKPDTWSVIEERRLLKESGLKTDSDRQEYSHLNRKVQRLCRRDRNAAIDEVCQDIERTANQAHTKDMFAKVKLLANDFKPQIWTIEDERGTPLIDKRLVLERWRQYCQQLYSQHSDAIEERMNYTEREPDILLHEVEAAIVRLKHKACGGDGISAQMIKWMGTEGTKLLHNICQKVWRTGHWPEDWATSVVVPLHKKGSTKKCENYRTISLTSHASKVLLHIINKRLENFTVGQIAKEQAGFVRGRGTREQILNLRQLIEKAREFNVPMALCFIDYAKAFDCINWKKMFSVMSEMGIPDHLIFLIQNLYLDGESKIRIEEDESAHFKANRGVRQGCILSPQLFNLIGEDIMRRVLEGWTGGIRVGGHLINNLRFADDTTIIGATETELAELLQRVEQVSVDYGLRINRAKTKLMFVDRASALQRTGELKDLATVQKFIYLGSMITAEGGCEEEVIRRIQMAKTAVKRLEKIWRNRGISRRSKVKLMQTLIFSIFLYASETWTLKARIRTRIDAFEMWCWRAMLNIPWTARRTNASILAELKVKTRLSSICMQRVLKYFGHVARKAPDNLEKLIVVGHVEGKRSRGRSPTRWTDVVKEACKGNMQKAIRLAENRSSWRDLVHTTTSCSHDPQP